MALRVDGRVVRRTAPRVAWELHYGPLPAGRRIAHRCRRPLCVRPDHLYLVRGRFAQEHVAGMPAPTLATPARRNGHFATGRLACGRTWWTRQRVLDGLRRFVEDTGQTPIASPRYARLARSRARSPRRRRYPSAYAILRHFPTLRSAWEAIGVPIADRRWATWSPAEDWYVREALGVLSTATVAADLGRGEAAVHAHAHRLGLHVTDVWGWPLQRVARAGMVGEYLLRGYVDRGELPVFKGAKNLYVDPGDLLVVQEIDWAHPPAVLAAAVRRSLRERLIHILRGRDWRAARPHRPRPARPPTGKVSHRLGARLPRPRTLVPGVHVRVVGVVPAMPQCQGREGRVERVYWSVHPRQHEPAPQWRALVVFAKHRRRRPGATIGYALPAAALQLIVGPVTAPVAVPVDTGSPDRGSRPT